jgi:hypothetical protein
MSAEKQLAIRKWQLVLVLSFWYLAKAQRSCKAIAIPRNFKERVFKNKDSIFSQICCDLRSKPNTNY